MARLNQQIVGYKRRAARQLPRPKKRQNVRKWKMPRMVPRGINYSNQMTLTVKRRCHVGTVTPGTVSTAQFYHYTTPSISSAGTICNTALTGLSNWAEYSALFDSFKINAIKLEFKPRVFNMNLTQNPPSAGATFVDIPYVSFIYDYRGAIVPTGVYSSATYNSFTENGKVITRRADRPFSIYLKPKVVEEYGVGARRYVSPKFTDTDTAGQNMPLRGFYMFWHNYAFTTVFQSMEVYATYYITFKGMK